MPKQTLAFIFFTPYDRAEILEKKVATMLRLNNVLKKSLVLFVIGAH